MDPERVPLGRRERGPGAREALQARGGCRLLPVSARAVLRSRDPWLHGPRHAAVHGAALRPPGVRPGPGGVRGGAAGEAGLGRCLAGGHRPAGGRRAQRGGREEGEPAARQEDQVRGLRRHPGRQRGLRGPLRRGGARRRLRLRLRDGGGRDRGGRWTPRGFGGPDVRRGAHFQQHRAGAPGPSASDPGQRRRRAVSDPGALLARRPLLGAG
mmetsp:Transcript_90066/g.241558  ORF Transcript_90066/g.241558 Transcript_90066/m.241558 type:complete len:212 (+) Transcript_90066:281-916(+)